MAQATTSFASATAAASVEFVFVCADGAVWLTYDLALVTKAPRSTRPLNAASANARRPSATRRPAGMPLPLRTGAGGGAIGLIGVGAVGSPSNMPIASLAHLSPA